jgi:hypothetical protein
MAKQSTVEILDVGTSEEAKEHLRAFSLDRPSSTEHLDSGSLTILGWVVGRGSRAVAIEVLADEEIVGRAPVEIERGGVSRGFKDVPGANTAGFRITMQGAGKGEGDLVVRAVLEDETRVPFARIRARIGRPRRLRRRRAKG